ncbi:MAG: hypothetical protein ACREXX_24080, partial [Gammaproteobacteria bacterium]
MIATPATTKVKLEIGSNRQLRNKEPVVFHPKVAPSQPFSNRRVDKQCLLFRPLHRKTGCDCSQASFDHPRASEAKEMPALFQCIEVSSGFVVVVAKKGSAVASAGSWNGIRVSKKVPVVFHGKIALFISKVGIHFQSPNKAPEPTTFAVTSRALVRIADGRAWTVRPIAARAAPAKA